MKDRASGHRLGSRLKREADLPNPILGPMDFAVPDKTPSSRPSPTTDGYGARLLRELRRIHGHDDLLTREAAERLRHADRDETVELLRDLSGRGAALRDGVGGEAQVIWPTSGHFDREFEREGPGRFAAALPFVAWLVGLLALVATS